MLKFYKGCDTIHSAGFRLHTAAKEGYAMHRFFAVSMDENTACLLPEEETHALRVLRMLTPFSNRLSDSVSMRPVLSIVAEHISFPFRS